MNILSNLEQIANIIIRPSRYTYKMTDLGNKCFKIQDKTMQRQDFQIKNPRGLKIKCSLYTSQKNYKQIEKCIIYLHCNSGCRVQGLAYLKQALDQNYSYMVFDFTGSGLSQGKYVSLGFYETIDLQCVYSHLKSLVSQKTKIILWGRSMGAVTGLNFLLQKKHNISFAIFDSPFKSLKDLFIQIGKQKTSFPEFILEMAYNYLKPIIQQKAGFNIQEVDLKLENNAINCPCVFIASKQDSLVPFQQIDEIFTLYKGQKEMHFIQQGHNEARNPKVIIQVFKSLKKHLDQQEINKKLRLQQLQQDKRNFNSNLNNNNEKLQKKELSRKKLQLTIKSLSQRQLLTTIVGKAALLKNQDLVQQRKVANLGAFQSRQNNNVIKLRVRQQNNPSLQKRLNNPTLLNQQNQHQSYQQSLQQTPNPILQKKPVSCLLPQNKKSLKALPIEPQQTSRFSFQPQTQRKILHLNKSQSKLKVKKKPMQIKNFFGNQNSINLSIEMNNQKNHIQREQKTQRIHYNNRVENKIKYQPLGEHKIENNILSLRELGPKQHIIKTIPSVQPSKPIDQYQSLNNQQQSLNTTKKFKPSSFLNESIKINIQSLSLQNQKEEPHSDIKTESHTKNKINIHQDFIREKQFLKRCQSLQKALKIQNITNKKVINQPTTHTYREIKCTERVLEKIIQKQEKKLLILNLQQINHHKTQTVRTKNSQNNQKTKIRQNTEQSNKEQNHNPSKKHSQRKTLQHIVKKTKPFVQLKGIRNSFEGKYKTQIRK